MNPKRWARGNLAAGRQTLAGLLGSWLAFSASADQAANNSAFSIQKETTAVVVRNRAGKVVLQYQFQRPADSKLSIESACYFHPVATPRGVVLTDVAPSDHLHHRGIFLAWVEMHGAKDADFWGWGEHAPKNGRRIVNQRVADLHASANEAGFTASNEWRAENACLMKEDLRVSVRATTAAHVLDLEYHLVPQADLTLAQWAFSGFCVRMRKDGDLEAESPSGSVKLPNPKHTEPTSDWPAAAWYDYALRLPDGAAAGVAVIDHPGNPPSLWHNHRDIRMLNPCIVAPSALVLKANQALNLRYRVVAHDGPIPHELLGRLAREWKSK